MLFYQLFTAAQIFLNKYVSQHSKTKENNEMSAFHAPMTLKDSNWYQLVAPSGDCHDAKTARKQFVLWV